MPHLEELPKLKNKDYRDAYLETQVCSGIAYQVQALRLKERKNQKLFAEKIGKPQSVVSRLENTQYGKVNVQTLLDIAIAMDVALVVKFVSYPKFLLEYDDVSPGGLNVENIDESFASSRPIKLQLRVSDLSVGSWNYNLFSLPTSFLWLSDVQATPMPTTIDQQGKPA